MNTSSIATAAPTAATAAANAGSTGADAAGLTQNFNTFLTLLTTQLRNQDPLSPLDTNQFTQQLVSFSQVEQAINTNKNLTTLIGLQGTNQTIAALPLVGRTVEYSDAIGPLSGGSLAFSYTLPADAARASLVVQDAQGNAVYTAAADPGSGRHAFTWDGQTNSGQQLPDGGNYTLKVMAVDATGASVNATITTAGKVDGVSVANGQASFEVGGRSVPISKLVTVASAS
jgi:flagellar basal-body rod modification protein FlgD